MLTLAVLALFSAFFLGFWAFIHFCEWVLARREVTV